MKDGWSQDSSFSIRSILFPLLYSPVCVHAITFILKAAAADYLPVVVMENLIRNDALNSKR